MNPHFNYLILLLMFLFFSSIFNYSNKIECSHVDLNLKRFELVEKDKIIKDHIVPKKIIVKLEKRNYLRWSLFVFLFLDFIFLGSCFHFLFSLYNYKIVILFTNCFLFLKICTGNREKKIVFSVF